MSFSRLALVAGFAVTLTACDAFGPWGGNGGPGDKIAVCHVDDAGAYQRIEISPHAARAHYRHGDGVPGGDAPGGGTFGENCEVIEEPAAFTCTVDRYTSGNGTPLVSISFAPVEPADYDLRGAGFTTVSGTPNDNPIVAVTADTSVRLIFLPSTDGPAVVTVDVPRADGSGTDSCPETTVD